MQEFIQQLHHTVELHYGHDTLKATNLHKYMQMSRSALHYKLRKHLGQSTAEFLRAYRIGKARALLLSTTESVKIIAFQVGFKDPNYFSRAFRQEAALSPTEFRKRSKLNNTPSNRDNSAKRS